MIALQNRRLLAEVTGHRRSVRYCSGLALGKEPTMKKFALALMTVTASVVGFGMSVEAQTPAPAPYNSGGGTATVSPASSAPGGSVAIAVAGCPAGSTISVVFNGATSTVTASATGTATPTVTAPTTAGTFAGRATCGAVVSSFSVVVAVPTVPGGGLPATGSGGIDATTSIAMGLFAVGLGLFGVTQVRRRQTVNA